MKPTTALIVLLVAACSQVPAAPDRAPADARIRVIAAGRAVDPLAMMNIPRDAGEADLLALALGFHVTDAGDADLAFRLGASGSEKAAAAIDWLVLPDASPDVVAAAATGLAMSKSDATERVLVALAMRSSHPPEALEALLGYYRNRGGDKPPPGSTFEVSAEAAIVHAYAVHPTARGRAALGHLGLAVKDVLVTDAVRKLADDPEWEVRRAVALALANGPEKTPRSKDDAARCIETLSMLVNDRDAHVVASACRAVSTYDDPRSSELLMTKLTHADFNVRVAALEGLGLRKSKNAVAELAKIARADPSTSCRYAAGKQLVGIEPTAARELVDGLLKDESEYVRSAAAEILGKAQDVEASKRLAEIAKSDPHVRVRETAVGGFEGKKDDVAKDAIRAALADADPVAVATACGVVAKNEWKDLVDLVAAVPARFPGCLGADAREAALSVLSELDGAAHRALFESYVHDENPAVRESAEKAIATLGGKQKDDPPAPHTRGADLTGELLPGGAPIFERDAFLIVETNRGTMKIRLFPDQAPVHCAHVAALARNGFYDGLTWHRVVPDFVIQGGCPRGDGSGNAGVTLPLEPTRIPFERGTLGMPRSDHPDTGGCQLFICHSRAPHLDVRYVAFGKVVEGLDVIDRIDVDDKILHVRVEGVR